MGGGLVAATVALTAPLSGGVLAAETLAKPLSLLLVVGAGLLVVVLGLADQRFLLVGGFLLYTAQMFNSSIVPVLTNVYAVVALMLVGLMGVLRGRLPRFEWLRTGVFPATFVYLLLGFVLLGRSVDIGESLRAFLSLGYLIAFCWIVLSAAGVEEIRSALRWTSGIVVGASLVLVVAMPSAAIGGYELEVVANRWRGITQNPNALSTFAGIFFFTAASTMGALASLVPTGLVLVGTASRSVALAMGVVAWPQVMRGRSRIARRIAVAVAVAVALPVLYTVFFSENTTPVSISDQALVRTTNTREESWSGAVDALREHPIGGLGPGNDFRSSDEGIPVSSSVLRPLVELGYPALIPLGLIALVGVRAARGRSSLFRSLFAFMVIHGIFEGWLFAGGSMLFVVFVLAASLMERSGTTTPEVEEAETVPAESLPAPA
jgi:hypothetical protein